jgi:mono/diheme cytochrome c family protein
MTCRDVSSSLAPALASGLLAILAALLAAACTPGSYPLDVFPEMHYQPSYRRLEPERLAVPSDAVPITGARPRLTFEQAAGLPNPVPRTPESLERARAIYRVNCAMCHGPNGLGDGSVAPYYRQNPLATVPPTSLAAPRVRDRTDGQLYWILANGLGGMPPYGELLAEQDLWTSVLFIRELQGP